MWQTNIRHEPVSKQQVSEIKQKTKVDKIQPVLGQFISRSGINRL